MAPPSQANSRPWQANEPGFLLFKRRAALRLAVIRLEKHRTASCCALEQVRGAWRGWGAESERISQSGQALAWSGGLQERQAALRPSEKGARCPDAAQPSARAMCVCAPDARSGAGPPASAGESCQWREEADRGSCPAAVHRGSLEGTPEFPGPRTTKCRGLHRNLAIWPATWRGGGGWGRQRGFAGPALVRRGGSLSKRRST